MALIGLDNVLRKFDKLPDRVVTLTKAAVTRNTDQIYAEAVSRVPKKLNKLSASGQKTVTDLTGTVSFGGGGVDYAPYVEFGTGPFAKSYLASMPKEIKSYAMTFFVNGQGRTEAQPFLIPAYLKYRKQFFKDMKDIAKIISK
jgi:HK97 gp10 family phage protein